MRRLLLSAIALLAVIGAQPAAAAAEDDPLWRAVFALGDAERAAAAEQRLRAAGADGLERLLQAARAGRQQRVDAALVRALGCADERGHRRGPLHKPATLPGRAAALAVAMLADDAALAAASWDRGGSLARSLVLLARLQRPAALLDALEAMEPPRSQLLLGRLRLLTRCLQRHRGRIQADLHRALRRRLADLRHAGRERVHRRPRTCPSAELAAALAAGRARVEHWGWGQRVQVTLRLDDESRVSIDGACALAVYRAARKRDALVDGLLRVVATRSRRPEQRQRAAELLRRDLERYPARKRERIAAELVNAGHRMAHRVQPALEPGDRLDARQQEAALRQGAPGAEQAVLERLACPDGSRVALLGFVAPADAATAADLAAGYAERCADLAGPAAAALVRLQDPRAVALLERVLDAKRWNGRDPLRRALLEGASEAVIDALCARAEQGNQRAIHLRAMLRSNGKL
jgi:hypothetical protein